MTPFGRPQPGEYLEYYERYISLVPEADLLPVLEAGLGQVEARLGGLDESAALARYAPDKWSVKQVLGHMTDVERVFGTRAWAVSRGEQQDLFGFDQDPYVEHGHFDRRPMGDLLQEHLDLRRANLALLRGWDAQASERRGRVSGHPASARAMAYVLAGHERHHLAVLEQRYGV